MKYKKLLRTERIGMFMIFLHVIFYNVCVM